MRLRGAGMEKQRILLVEDNAQFRENDAGV